MIKKIGLSNILLVLGLIIFTVVALNLSVGWFTIVMPIFATFIFIMILLSPDENKKP